VIAFKVRAWLFSTLRREELGALLLLGGVFLGEVGLLGA